MPLISTSYPNKIYIRKFSDMVVTINGIFIHQPTIEEILCNDFIINQNNLFLNEALLHTVTDYSLFIDQGEYALLNLNNSSGIKLVGTEGATTCHIIVLYDDLSVGFSHIDSTSSLEYTIDSIANELGDEISLCVIGGFLDHDNISLPISEGLLDYFCNSPKTFNVKYWSTMQLNTKHDNNGIPSPIITNASFDLENKSFCKATFTYRGPELELRKLWRHKSKEPVNIFNQTLNCIEIPYFVFDPIPEYLNFSMAPDRLLLEHCSTSPHCEPEYFCQDLRNSFHYMAINSSTAVFGPNKQSIIYFVDKGGKWTIQIP